MAQSSDSNDSFRDDESDSHEAEQILGSIIGHIEMSDGEQNAQSAVSSDRSELEHSVGGVEVPEQALQTGVRHSGQVKPDFGALEKRAADLANRLGGFGLSYSAGAKTHLSDVEEVTEQDLEPHASAIDASIHIEDVAMENLVIDVAHEGQLGDVGGEISEEQYHVSEWEADAHRDLNEDHANALVLDDVMEKPALEDVLLAPSAQGDSIDQGGVDQAYSVESEITAFEPDQDVVFFDESHSEKDVHVYSNVDSSDYNQAGKTDLETVSLEFAEEKTGDATPDLRDIEQQIEALSVSMKQADEGDSEQELSDQIFHEPDSVRHVDVPVRMEEIDRVASLEKQVVELLDKTTRSDQQLREAVVQVMRDETQNAVQEALATSDLMVNLKSELDSSAEQRHLQDTRMADSLDALHDALKDIGERVSVVESASLTQQSAYDGEQSSFGGVASSVLGAQLKALTIAPVTETEELVESEEPEQEVPSQIISAEAELPTWLEDSTQDLHRQEQNGVVEQADVFASACQTTLSPAVEEAEMLQEKSQVDVVEPSSPIEHETLTRELPVENSMTQPEQEVVEPVAETLEPQVEIEEEPIQTAEVYVPRKKAEKPDSKGNNFLQAARMAARAANERASQADEQSDKSSKESVASVKRSNFIAAAKQKQRETEQTQKPLAPAPKRPAKNSLFSDKAEGPNSLLVFTSLILFGTSALLLYGMSRNGEETGSVAKLNAVEQKLVDGEIAPDGKLGKRKLVSPGNKTKNASDKKKRRSKRLDGKRSRLNGLGGKTPTTGSQLALVKKTDAMSGRDTLTGFDKLVADRLAAIAPVPSSIEFTGAIPNRTSQEKAGSLFEEYVSFSGLSNEKKSTKKSSLPITGTDQKMQIALSGTKGLLATASNGDALAQYEVARRFSKGIGVKKSPAISVEWYEKSAKAGYAPAIYRLATMYERGNGVAKNYQRAMELYISAATKGNVKSMHNLAVLYTGGNLGTADYHKAINWYRKAANYGVKDSQFNLAIIYQNGMGGTQNMEKAYKWYTLASRSGDEEAKDLLIDVRDELNDTQRRKMDRELGAWKAKTPDVNANSAKQYSGAMGQTKVAKR